jgi:hypothetical protein
VSPFIETPRVPFLLDPDFFFSKITEIYFTLFPFFTFKMKESEDRPAQKFYISCPSIGYMKKKQKILQLMVFFEFRDLLTLKKGEGQGQ